MGPRLFYHLSMPGSNAAKKAHSSAARVMGGLLGSLSSGGCLEFSTLLSRGMLLCGMMNWLQAFLTTTWPATLRVSCNVGPGESVLELHIAPSLVVSTLSLSLQTFLGDREFVKSR